MNGMNRLAIVGASGHGKVAADIARLVGYEEIVFLDDNDNLTKCGRYPVIGKVSDVSNIKADVFVAIGNAEIRCKIMNEIGKCVTLIHPDAVIAEDVSIGEGTVIMAGTVINSGTIIGNGCIVNTCSSVDHDCILSDFVHVAVGAHLCGTVSVGEGTWIGAGATVSNNISICDQCMIGAGSVVVKNLIEPGLYKGVPAVLS